MTRPLPFVLVASDHGPMIVNRLDYHTLPNGATYGVGHQILTNGAYDPTEIQDIIAELRVLRARRGDGLVVLDCGANIGVHTVELGRAMIGWGSVTALECQERLYYALCGNIAINNLFNVSALWSAVGNEDGYLDIPRPNYNRPASFGSLEMRRSSSTEYIGQTVSYSSKNLQRVQQVKIDTICQNFHRLDFIKLDVEGMEIETLAGAEFSINQFRPTLFIEWIKSERAALQDFLSSHGYIVSEKGANLLAEWKPE